MDESQPDDTIQKQDDSKPSVSVDVPFTPYDHTTTQVPVDDSLSAFGYNPAPAPKEGIGFLEGAQANWEDKNETWRLLHGSWDRTEDYLDTYKDPNFNPLQFQDKFQNVKPEYQSYLMASDNEKQMDFRLKRIQHEQWLDDTVKNSSWTQWIVGGGAGMATDLINYIPVIGQMKYARWGKTATSCFEDDECNVVVQPSDYVVTYQSGRREVLTDKEKQERFE